VCGFRVKAESFSYLPLFSPLPCSPFYKKIKVNFRVERMEGINHEEQESGQNEGRGGTACGGVRVLVDETFTKEMLSPGSGIRTPRLTSPKSSSPIPIYTRVHERRKARGKSHFL